LARSFSFSQTFLCGVLINSAPTDGRKNGHSLVGQGARWITRQNIAVNGGIISR
jgi:hypothetical protein